MNDEASFIQAMLEKPEDNHLRLVFADWLEERGDSRGELIRLLHRLTQAIDVPDRSKLEDRLRSLLADGVQPVGPFWTNSIGMKFAWIPAGTFMMGSPRTEKRRETNERPHQVTLSKGFWLAIHPVTQACWRKVMRKSPSYFRGADRPVEQVSWDDCQDFLQKLNNKDSHTYRLPSEAEWEYACRAGTTTPFYFGNTITTDQSNYRGQYPYADGEPGEDRMKTTPVGSFAPNGWGLHDTHGNLMEWCGDWYGEYGRGKVVDPHGPATGEERVVRGGSFSFAAWNVRSADRRWHVPADRDRHVGFRPVRSAP
jgi:sulfatase modifying factor 1